MASLVRSLTRFRSDEVDRLWKNARPAFKQDGFLLLKAPKSGEFGRILIVTAKKVGTAPERNNVRRRVKAIFYEQQIYRKEFDWIFFAKPPVTALTFQELQKLLLAVF